ncbi:MAG: 3-oxoadipyl-CoA thiolase [Gemmatimonadaceae bacterium]|nr:3-oxoadipyl-CoA thiolase [Gemmatimonadaceae bacterium]
MAQAFIVDGIRSPIGSFGGSLAHVRPDDLAAHVIRELAARNPSIDPARIDDVILGCANQAGEDNRNVARMALLLAGLPERVPGETVNRLCASGMSAVAAAARAIRASEGDVFIAGGVENMTRAPFVMGKTSQPFARNVEIFDTSIGWRFINPRLKDQFGTDSMGETAENVAERYGVSREDQDAYALSSQRKAAASRESGRFDVEITPVPLPAPGKNKPAPPPFAKDEFIRGDSTPEALAKLKPAFRHDGKGSVTAGNSSGLNDGAAALYVLSDSALKEFGVKPLARVVATAASGVEPRVMGIAPVPAVRKVLQLAGLSLNQIDLIEFNEAFAAQVIASLRELGVKEDDQRVNPNGGAIALGHPLGMSGARLLLTASRELEKSGKRYAVCTMCVGVGQGMATVLERV